MSETNSSVASVPARAYYIVVVVVVVVSIAVVVVVYGCSHKASLVACAWSQPGFIVESLTKSSPATLVVGTGSAVRRGILTMIATGKPTAAF